MSEIDKFETANISGSAFGVGRLKPGSLVVTVGSNVAPKNLHDIIDVITKLHGCLNCGFGGLDVLLRAQDPRILDSFKHIKEVKDVTIFR